MPDNRTRLIPVVKRADPRYEKSGDVNTPVVNYRMTVQLTDNPGFALDLGGREAAWAAADLIRQGLVANYEAGRDARGVPLPALDDATIKRRERRARQWERGERALTKWRTAKGKKAKQKVAQGHADTIGSHLVNLQERFKLRGRSPSGRRDYRPMGGKVPFNESGLIAQNVVVYWKGFNKKTGEGEGDPTFDIAWPTGGKQRGLHNDDGKGARLFAVRHYGFERMADIPDNIEARLDMMLDNYLSRLSIIGKAGIGILQGAARIGAGLEELAATAATGETGED